ncbi:GNAT family N-acetyltransferase [Actinoplanes sp. NPDC051411]|uniref:GNAT family N-acetyltransferase n=1 Tax=Actinoplanes sp. NPDC051411 TaxID=3155522 RepID=UPI00343E5FBA
MGTYALREAGPDDADSIALLHADSWRRHYRGAYADSFLDGDVEADRLRVWAGRLADPGPGATLLAEDAWGLAGFIHVVFDDDPRWGSLIDNLHVRADLHRTGLGTTLVREGGRAVLAGADREEVYLWVLEQNTAAQAFYRARGARQAERCPCRPPGIPVNGDPYTFRMVWPTARALAGE